MTRMAKQLKARTRLLVGILVALAFFWLLPASFTFTTRALVAWDVGIVLYLVLSIAMMARSNLHSMRARARYEDDGAIAVLILILAAALASFGAIAAELQGLNETFGSEKAFRLSLVIVTILCSWFFVSIIFAIHYAHDYFGDEGRRQGLNFHGETEPDYWDFCYFSFNLGAAFQTADIEVTTRRMRRLVLGHTIFAFLFNTTILAFAINVSASLIS